jgi:hypothetical protein
MITKNDLRCLGVEPRVVIVVCKAARIAGHAALVRQRSCPGGVLEVVATGMRTAFRPLRKPSSRADGRAAVSGRTSGLNQLRHASGPLQATEPGHVSAPPELTGSIGMTGTQHLGARASALEWRSWPTRLIDLIDRTISARTDEPLRERDYTITKVAGGRPWTRTQEYRLSTRDRRRRRDMCQGAGQAAQQPGRLCPGTGVITENAVEAGRAR